MTIGRIALGVCTLGISEGVRKIYTTLAGESTETEDLKEKHINPETDAAKLREASQGIHLAEPVIEILETEPIDNPNDFLRPDEINLRDRTSQLSDLQNLEQKIALRKQWKEFAGKNQILNTHVSNMFEFIPNGRIRELLIQDSSAESPILANIELKDLILQGNDEKELTSLIKAALFAQISDFVPIHNRGGNGIPSYYANNTSEACLKTFNFDVKVLAQDLTSFRENFEQLSRTTGKKKNPVFE